MSFVLWIAQVVLAFIFLMAGAMKLAKTKAELGEQMAWVEDVTESRLLTIGVLELLGAIGLILPGITGIGPLLVPLAATGLGLIMILAARLHFQRSEMPNVAVNVILLVLAVFVAWGRFGSYAL